MPSSTPASPSAPGPSVINPTMPGTSAIDPTTPSNTPGCLERRDAVVARSQHAETTPTPIHTPCPSWWNLPGWIFWIIHYLRSLTLDGVLNPRRMDLYFNRAQTRIVSLCILHIGLFIVVINARDAGCFKDHNGNEPRFNLGLFFALFDEVGPFCLYTAYALLECRNPRTVARWEFVAMAFSWAKSGVVLGQTYVNVNEGRRGPVKLPETRNEYVVFGLVRFLVFGGLWKMVQAGLRKRWEREWVAPPPRIRVARLHRAVPARLQRRVGPGVQRRRIRDPLDTLEGRKAYWTNIRERGW